MRWHRASFFMRSDFYVVRGAASLATRHREKNLAAWRRIIDRASAAAEVPGSRTPTEEVAR